MRISKTKLNTTMPRSNQELEANSQLKRHQQQDQGAKEKTKVRRDGIAMEDTILNLQLIFRNGDHLLVFHLRNQTGIVLQGKNKLIIATERFYLQPNNFQIKTSQRFSEL